MNNPDKTETFNIESKFAGKRADVVLALFLSGHTRSQIKKLINDECVLVNGKPIKASKKFEGGECVEVTLPEPEPIEAVPEDIPLSILFEDDYIVVINKPAGMTVHPGAGVRRGTLVNAVLYRCSGLSGIGGKIRPGIVHRLDKDTSGVIVVAKNDEAHNSLVEQFKEREVKKTYMALVEGNIKKESGVFKSRIGRHPKNRIKMSSQSDVGRESVTFWTVEEKYGEATLVKVMPQTGRTHQIRVHFSENGHAILADKVYKAGKQKSHIINMAAKEVGRHALHAYKLGFTHPDSGEFLEFRAPIPEDINKAIKYIKEHI